MSIALQCGASIEKLGDLLTSAQFAPCGTASGFYLGQGRICSAGACVSAREILLLVEEFVLNGAKQLGKVEWLYEGLPGPKESGRL